MLNKRDLSCIEIKITEENLENILSGEFFELDKENGAVCLFLGVVREDYPNQKSLFYEDYTEMAVKQMEEIVHKAKDKFNLNRIKVIHRVGEVKIGEASVVVLVHSKHRKEAFKGCKYIIDQIKKKVPIWKS